MSFFTLNKETFELDISPETVLLTPFKKIILRDKSKNKNKAMGELAYVYYMVDYKSEFQSVLDEKQRSLDVISMIDSLSERWKPDKIIKDAIKFYRERNETIASLALEAQRDNIQKLINKIGDFIDSTDSNDVNRAVSMSEKLPKLIASIDDLEKVVKGQIEAKASTHRGSQEPGMYEDAM